MHLIGRSFALSAFVVLMAAAGPAQAAPHCQAGNPMMCARYHGKSILTCVKYAEGRPGCCLQYACRPPHHNRD